jgi:hypothetical protein
MFSWFFPCKEDTSSFLFDKSGITMFILVYVDGIVVIGSSDSAPPLKLIHEFVLTELRDLHFFLGIEVHKLSNGLLLNQHKYAHDLWVQVGMTTYTSCPTPLSTSDSLSLTDGSPLGPEDIIRCRSIVGAL